MSIHMKNLLAENMRRFGTKNLSEQQTQPTGTTVTKIDLPDGDYLGDGSGGIYKIKDTNGKDTGYTVESSLVIRGAVNDDPVKITNGIPYSKTWGRNGIYTFKDIGYSPQSSNQTQSNTNKISSEGIKNVSEEMINANSNKFPGQYSGYEFTGTFNGTTYNWDANGVQGMSGIRGVAKGYILTGHGSDLAEYQITDVAPNSVCVGFYSNQQSIAFMIYQTTSGTVICKSLK